MSTVAVLEVPRPLCLCAWPRGGGLLAGVSPAILPGPAQLTRPAQSEKILQFYLSVLMSFDESFFWRENLTLLITY